MTRSMHWKYHAAGASAILAMLAGFYVLGVAPSSRLRTEESSRKRELLQLASQVEEQNAENARVREDVARVRRAVEAERIVLTPVSRLTSRVAAIAASGERVGVVIEELNPSAAERVGLFEQVPIRLTGTARWRSLERFLEVIADEMRDTAVVRVRLDGSGLQGSEPRFELLLRWFAEPEQTLTAQAGQAAQSDR